MFSGTVDRVSHEGGLLVSYTGSCPALGSVMVDSNDEYIGKVDGVIGNTDSSLVHIAHLDRKSRAEKLVGITVLIRTKKPNQNRTFDRRNDRGNDRRSDRRNDRRQSNQISNSRDWECKSCGNSNFSFRTECNRCGEPKNSRSGSDNRRRDDRRGGNRRGDNQQRRDNYRNDNRRGDNRRGDNRQRRDNFRGDRRNDNRRDDNRQRRDDYRGDNRRGDRNRDNRERNSPPKRAGDWDCPSCGKSNFANRTECFSCGKSKRVGGPKQRGHHRKQKSPPGLHSARYGRGSRD